MFGDCWYAQASSENLNSTKGKLYTRNEIQSRVERISNCTSNLIQDFKTLVMYISSWVSYERPGVVLIRTLQLTMRPYWKLRHDTITANTQKSGVACRSWLTPKLSYHGYVFTSWTQHAKLQIFTGAWKSSTASKLEGLVHQIIDDNHNSSADATSSRLFPNRGNARGWDQCIGNELVPKAAQK